MCKLFYPTLYHFDLSKTQNIYVYLVEVQKDAKSIQMKKTSHGKMYNNTLKS